MTSKNRHGWCSELGLVLDVTSQDLGLSTRTVFQKPSWCSELGLKCFQISNLNGYLGRLT